MPLWPYIRDAITHATGVRFRAHRHRKVSGGCINRAYIFKGNFKGNAKTYFIKPNTANRIGMFQAETTGLLELSRAQASRTPRTRYERALPKTIASSSWHTSKSMFTAIWPLLAAACSPASHARQAL
jgi:fructosamine-3-kinase